VRSTAQTRDVTATAEARENTLSAFHVQWSPKSGVGKEHARRVGSRIRRFEELHGSIPAASVTRKMVRDFVDVLAVTPRNSNLSLAKRKLPLPALVKLGEKRRAEGVELPTLTQGAIERHIVALSKVFKWAEKNELVEGNPAQGVETPAHAREGTDVEPFRPDQLRHMLSFVDKAWRRDAKTVKPYDLDRWWIAQVAVYSGARLEEISQLTKADVYETRGTWILDINKTVVEGRSQKIKNKPSARKIPMHPKLIDMGFLEHVERSKGPRVFASLDAGHKDRYGENVGKAFSALKTKAGFDARHNFHSFRHSFEDAGAEAEVPEDAREQLLGHKAGMYGKGRSFATLAKIIERIDPLTE
jgi:integrase